MTACILTERCRYMPIAFPVGPEQPRPPRSLDDLHAVVQVTVPGGMVGEVSTPVPAVEVAAMVAGMDAAFAAAAAAGADNGVAIVDPRNGQARLLPCPCSGTSFRSALGLANDSG